MASAEAVTKKIEKVVEVEETEIHLILSIDEAAAIYALAAKVNSIGFDLVELYDQLRNLSDKHDFPNFDTKVWYGAGQSEGRGRSFSAISIERAES